jgi:transcriptional regulator with XRE-family HTH domain
MELRDRIKTARKALGISQEELARRAEVSLSLINQIERGVVVDPHYSTLVNIAEALSMSIGELLEEPVPLGEAPQESGPSEEEERRSRAAWEAYGGGEAADHGEGPAEYISAPTSVVAVPADLYGELLRAAEDRLDPETLRQARELKRRRRLARS